MVWALGSSAQVAVPIVVLGTSSGMLLGLPSGRPNEKALQAHLRSGPSFAPVASASTVEAARPGRIRESGSGRALRRPGLVRDAANRYVVTRPVFVKPAATLPAARKFFSAVLWGGRFPGPEDRSANLTAGRRLDGAPNRRKQKQRCAGCEGTSKVLCPSYATPLSWCRVGATPATVIDTLQGRCPAIQALVHSLAGSRSS
jgi:hypothetical protein